MRVLAAAFVIPLLAGCSILPTPQLSNETIPFPARYRDVAKQTAQQQGFVMAATRTSLPQPTIGRTITDPRQWYICISDRPAGVHDAIILFPAKGTPSTLNGHESPLCSGLAYAAL